MATRDSAGIDIFSSDPIDLYEAWHLNDVYGFNLFCMIFLMLDLPLLRDGNQ